MRIAGIALTFVFALSGAFAQAPAPRNGGQVGRVGLGNVPLVMWGSGGNLSTPNSSGNLNGWGYWNSYATRLYPYYWGVGANATANNLPTGPSYANPAAVLAAKEVAAPLIAPDNGKSGAEWADARSSFASASAKVTQARTAVEDLRARLAAMGQGPRATLITNTATAEAAIKSAQSYIASGNLEETLREIQRANYLAAQVLKEFGR
ncbi:MAG: hypothetical protein ABIR70_02940 [Bryobacteraceae bacterium]